MTALHTIDTVVIGAGHAGLAVSRLLTLAGREHVVLDRGRVGERWRTARWDSLHLLTPNWLNRLPGWRTAGPTRTPSCPPATSSSQLERYAASFDAPGPDRHDGDAADHRAGRRLRGPHATTAPGGPARSSSPPDRTASPLVPAAVGRADVPRGHQRPVPQPRPPGRRWRPGRRRLGVRGADRRRAGPVGPRGGPGGRAAHPGAPPLPRDGHLLVAGVHRPAGAHDRRGARPGGRPPRAVAAAGRTVRRRRGRERRRPGRAAASGRPADRPAAEPGRAARRGSATSSTALTADADRRMHALLDSVDRYVDRRRPGPGGAGARPSRDASRRRRAVPARPARGRDPDGRPGDRLPPGQRLGRPADHRRRRHLPPDPRRDRRTGRLRRRPALPAPPGLRLHRRGPPRRARRRAPPDRRGRADRSGPARAPAPARSPHERLRRRHRRWPGRRRLDRAAAGARGRSASACSSARGPARTPSPPMR